MRYSGLLFLAFFAGCMDAGNTPVSKPTNVDNLPGAPQHTVNKPVVKGSDVDPDPNPGPAFNRGTDATAPRLDPGSPDNTGTNERDRNTNNETPFDQGNSTKDIKLTADIRQQIVNRSGMSINARNIKIISKDGKVVLRGPVESQAEKDLIDQMAKDTAGAANVENHLDIVPPKSE